MPVLALIRRVLNGDDLTKEEWAAVIVAISFMRSEGGML